MDLPLNEVCTYSPNVTMDISTSGGRIIFEQDTEGTVIPEQLVTRLHLHLGSREKPRARISRAISPVQVVGQVLWKTLGFSQPSMRLKLAFD